MISMSLCAAPHQRREDRATDHVTLMFVSADFAFLLWAHAAGTASRLHLQLKGGSLAGQAKAIPAFTFVLTAPQCVLALNSVCAQAGQSRQEVGSQCQVLQACEVLLLLHATHCCPSVNRLAYLAHRRSTYEGFEGFSVVLYVVPM